MIVSKELQEYIEYNVDLLENWDNKNNQFSFYNNISVECLEEANQLLKSIDLPISIKYTYFRVFDWIMWECINPDITGDDVYDLMFNNDHEIVLQYETGANTDSEITLQIRYDINTDKWTIQLNMDDWTRQDFYDNLFEKDFNTSGDGWIELANFLIKKLKWTGFQENGRMMKTLDPSKSKKYIVGK